MHPTQVRTLIAGRPPESAGRVTATAISYPVASAAKTIAIDGRVRMVTYDVLFNGSFEDESIASSILNAIAKCSRDVRKGGWM